MQRPAADEYAPFYETYISKVPDGDVIDLLAEQIRATEALLIDLPEERARHRYAPEKWSVKEVIGHMTDTERVMSYRALCVARGDQTPLPKFDENAFVAAANFDEIAVPDLVYDLLSTRQASIQMLRSLGEEASTRRGTASGHIVSVRALAYIIAGHELHHCGLLRDRYGLS